MVPRPCEGCGQQLGLQVTVPVRIGLLIALLLITFVNHYFLPAASIFFAALRGGVQGGIAGIAFLLIFGRLVRYVGWNPQEDRSG